MPSIARAVAGRVVKLLVVGACALAGCHHDAAAPVVQAPFADAAAISASMYILDSTLASAGMQSLAGLGQFMQAAAPASSSAPAGSFAPAACGAGMGAAGAAGAAPLFAPASGGSLIADSLRRHVYVLVPPFASYTRTSDTSGPVNGVRFRLYAVDTMGVAIAPLSIIGNFDLLDVSTGTASSLRGLISTGASTNVDYLITPRGHVVNDTVILAGTASQNGHSFSFTDSITRSMIQFSSQTTMVATLTDAADDITIRISAAFYAYDLYDGNYTTDFTLTHGPHSVRMTGNIFTYCLLPAWDLDLSADTVPVAQVTNSTTTSGPAVVPAATLALSPEQALAALDVMYGQQRLFKWLVGMAAPVAPLLPP
ncbi:MAG TPA: hypothetical protein VGI92_04125 [Gemmatimonadales bacterium]|jgi:hypothetical protein